MPVLEVDDAELAELTWAGICAGCHAWGSRRVGPSVVQIRESWAGRVGELADWIAVPEPRRPGYPAMPPQNYLAPEVRLAVARYVLEELEP